MIPIANFVNVGQLNDDKDFFIKTAPITWFRGGRGFIPIASWLAGKLVISTRTSSVKKMAS